MKPENLLLASSEPGAALKAIDFGLAALVKPDSEAAAALTAAAAAEGEKGKAGSFFRGSASSSSSFLSKEPLTDLCGSPMYIAPEVLRRSYGKEADMWSVGVITHVLLTGHAPFEALTEKELFSQILTKKLDIRKERSEPWPQISPGAKDFVARLLERDPRKRLTARQALEHPWLAVPDAEEKQAMMKCMKQLNVLKTMCNFAVAGAVRRRAAAVVAERAPPEVIEALLPAFEKVDAGDARDGTVALGALPSLLGCVDAGMAALKGGADAAAASAAVAAVGDIAAEGAVAVAAAGTTCLAPPTTSTVAAAPPPPPPSYSHTSPTAKAIASLFRELMGHDGTQCCCRVDYAAFLKAATEEARALREETLATLLGRLDPKKTGELPRSKLEAATKRHLKAIPQHVIDRAVEAVAEAAAQNSCAPMKLAKKKEEHQEKGTGGGSAAPDATRKGGGEEEEETVDYELFCAALAKVCPSCPKAAKAA